MQQTVNNGDSGLDARNKINGNFTELYGSITTPIKLPGVGANTSVVIPANSFITNLYVALATGSPTIRIGTTPNGQEILPDSEPFQVLSLNQYFANNTTLYITVSGGSVNIRIELLKSFF